MTRLKQPGYEEFLLFKNEAASKNDALQRQRRETSTFGVAKPVIAFTDDTYAPEWKLRTRTLTPNGGVEIVLTSLHAPSMAAVAQTQDGADAQAAQTSYADTDYVSKLAEAYRQRPSAAQQGDILHALHRLQIYTKLAGGQGDDAGAGYRAFFADTLQRVEADDAGLRRADVAETILGGLKQATGYYRELSLSLLDVSYKLATKTARRPHDAELRVKLTLLVERGLDNVTSDTSPADLQKFLSAFAYASRSFFSSDVGARAFAGLLDKVVEGLRHKRIGDRSPVFDLFMRLSDRLMVQKDRSMIAPLESLLNNEKFNVYFEQLTSDTEVDYLKSVLTQLVRDDRHEVWQAGVRLLVRRPSGEFYQHLEGLITPSGNGCVAKIKLNYLFDLLNESFAVVRECRSAVQDPQVTTAYRQAQDRYRGFLAGLVKVNRLHFVEIVAAASDAQPVTIENLQALYNSPIADREQLQRFFSNAGFKASQYFAHDASVLRRDVEAVLQLARANPVNNAAKFEDNLELIADDYQLGLPHLRGLILRTLGAGSAPGKVAAGSRAKSRPVEDWLSDTLIPSYQRLMRVVLGCYPLTWEPENFDTPDWYNGKLVMAESGQLFVAGTENGNPKLADIIDREAAATAPEDKENYHSADCDLDALYQNGDALAQHEGVNRAVRALVHNSNSFANLGLDRAKTERMDQFLEKLLVRLQLSALGASNAAGTNAATLDAAGFEARIDAVATFFGGVSELQRSKLEKEAARRYFRGDVLTGQGRKFLGEEAASSTTDFKTLRSAIADRLFDIGCDVIERFFVASPDANALIDGVKNIAPVFNREIDYRAYTTELIVEAFNKRHQQVDGRSNVEVSEESTEVLRKSLYIDAEAALKSSKIDYIMPNQALAAELCRRSDFIDDNILIKMGTGQGKSIVVAMTALHEARRLEPGQYVFVLTSYDHLAIGDHQSGRKFFKDVQSTCIQDVKDLDNLPADTKIVYTNVKTFQNVVQKAVQDQIQAIANPEKYTPHPKQRDFLLKLFANTHRFILDEYDLVLNDLDFSDGAVKFFKNDVIDRSFVAANRAYAPSIANYTTPLDASAFVGRGRDQHSGDGFGTIARPYVTTHEGTGYYLRPGGLRVSRLLAKAKRIIGLSGSTEGDSFSQVLGLDGVQAKYFELPSSRDPESFGTRIVDSKEALGGVPGIYCTQHKEEIASEAEYIASIVNDVRAVRVPRDVPGAEGRQEIRPVMIFVDPDKQNLTRDLLKALRETFGEGAVPKPKFNSADIKGPKLQEIGFPGSVTLVSTLCGRGADIYVSPDVPDSMHVVIATSIPTDRLRIQMIGRTGRMGRDGSYSVLTMGKLIAPASTEDNRLIENLVHDLSDEFMGRLASPQGCDKDLARRWLLLSSELIWAVKDAKDDVLLNVAMHRHEFA